MSFFQMSSRCRVCREEVCVCQFQGQADAFSLLSCIFIMHIFAEPFVNPLALSCLLQVVKGGNFVMVVLALF